MSFILPHAKMKVGRERRDRQEGEEGKEDGFRGVVREETGTGREVEDKESEQATKRKRRRSGEKAFLCEQMDGGVRMLEIEQKYANSTSILGAHRAQSITSFH